jgi:transposase
MAAKNPKHPKISHLASLPDSVTITNIVKREHCDEFFVTFNPPAHRACPHCGSNDCVVKDSRYAQTVRHVAIAQRGTIITLRKRRLFCKSCHSTFFENPEWLHPSLHMTNPLWFKLCLDLTQMLSVAMIARNNYVTPSVVTSVLDSISWEHPSQLPETLCVDEFKGSSGVWDSEKSRWDITKYHCNISDGEAGIIIDILPRITAEHLKGYFHKFSSEQRKRVKYYCCDMHNGFISVARELFPDANICIDMFHVVKLLNDTVESIRRRLQRDMEEQQNKESHRILKNVSRSLLTSEIKQERLANPNNAKRREKLKVVFGLFPDLAEAYDALQEFHAINNTPLLILQKSNLTDWIIRNCDSTVPELEKTARSIRHWRGYIQNTWEYHRSNSTCEGLNNKIKVLKRVSFGLHCFETFRKRVLLTCGYLRLSNDPFTIFNEKRKGKGIKL